MKRMSLRFYAYRRVIFVVVVFGLYLVFFGQESLAAKTKRADPPRLAFFGLDMIRSSEPLSEWLTQVDKISRQKLSESTEIQMINEAGIKKAIKEYELDYSGKNNTHFQAAAKKMGIEYNLYCSVLRKKEGRILSISIYDSQTTQNARANFRYPIEYNNQQSVAEGLAQDIPQKVMELEKKRKADKGKQKVFRSSTSYDPKKYIPQEGKPFSHKSSYTGPVTEKEIQDFLKLKRINYYVRGRAIHNIKIGTITSMDDLLGGKGKYVEIYMLSSSSYKITTIKTVPILDPRSLSFCKVGDAIFYVRAQYGYSRILPWSYELQSRLYPATKGAGNDSEQNPQEQKAQLEAAGKRARELAAASKEKAVGKKAEYVEKMQKYLKIGAYSKAASICEYNLKDIEGAIKISTDHVVKGLDRGTLKKSTALEASVKRLVKHYDTPGVDKALFDKLFKRMAESEDIELSSFGLRIMADQAASAGKWEEALKLYENAFTVQLKSKGSVSDLSYKPLCEAYAKTGKKKEGVSFFMQPAFAATRTKDYWYVSIVGGFLEEENMQKEALALYTDYIDANKEHRLAKSAEKKKKALMQKMGME